MKTQDLLEALTTVKPGLSDKEFIEQSTSFAFKDGKVITYNDEISVMHPVEGLEVEGAVKASELYAFLNKVKTEEITLKEEGNELFLKAGRSKVWLSMEKEITLTTEHFDVKKKWEDIPEGFFEKANFVSRATSKDASTPALTCIKVTTGGELIATDRYRIFVHSGEPFTDEDFLLPADTIPILTKLKPSNIAIGKEWIYFKTTEGTVLSIRTITDEFPEAVGFIESLPSKPHKIKFPVKLQEIVERAAVFSKSEFAYDRFLNISLKENRIYVKTKSDNARFEENTKMKYNMAPREFRVMTDLLKDILEEKDCVVKLYSDKILFETSQWSYLAILQIDFE